MLKFFFFCSQNESIKKIVIDRSPFGKPINVYDQDHMLDDTQDINEFDCRKGLFRRSSKHIKIN